MTSFCISHNFHLRGLIIKHNISRRAFATLTSAFGSELFHGPKISDSGVRLVELPKEKHAFTPDARLMYRKYPKEVRHTKASYILKKKNMQLYNMTMKDHEMCIIGSTCSKQLNDNRINQVRKVSI